ncbi:hypothetical protein LTR53_001394 [Teratosphaeriaceae sp. CCFEE 6253]|nr:hypothetical protein LTR53_001394 [Teratosphaeriaceae sp. CCFEE 6253]
MIVEGNIRTLTTAVEKGEPVVVAMLCAPDVAEVTPHWDRVGIVSGMATMATSQNNTVEIDLIIFALKTKTLATDDQQATEQQLDKIVAFAQLLVKAYF